ncbi:hypothetical protein [Streptomyces sp. NPDC090025]|uniref:hypothetical protein n=1 Tax=Streptomyces sp. NPDC090025 TaxID=3365922 RepID=UPI003832C43B
MAGAPGAGKAALRAAVTARAEAVGVRVLVRHSLVRSAVVELSTSAERRGVHRALAEAWATVTEQRARHLAEAADLSARRGDGPDTGSALVRAAELSPEGAAYARRPAEAAYVGADLTGDVRDVPALREDARQVFPDTRSPAVAVAAALHLLNAYGDLDTAHRLRTTFADPARARPEDWARLDAAVLTLPGTSDPVRIVRVATAGAYADRRAGLRARRVRRVPGGPRRPARR